MGLAIRTVTVLYRTLVLKCRYGAMSNRTVVVNIFAIFLPLIWRFLLFFTFGLLSNLRLIGTMLSCDMSREVLGQIFVRDLCASVSVFLENKILIFLSIF